MAKSKRKKVKLKYRKPRLPLRSEDTGTEPFNRKRSVARLRKNHLARVKKTALKFEKYRQEMHGMETVCIKTVEEVTKLFDLMVLRIIATETLLKLYDEYPDLQYPTSRSLYERELEIMRCDFVCLTKSIDAPMTSPVRDCLTYRMHFDGEQSAITALETFLSPMPKYIVDMVFECMPTYMSATQMSPAYEQNKPADVMVQPHPHASDSLKATSNSYGVPGYVVVASEVPEAEVSPEHAALVEEQHTPAVAALLEDGQFTSEDLIAAMAKDKADATAAAKSSAEAREMQESLYHSQFMSVGGDITPTDTPAVIETAAIEPGELDVCAMYKKRLDKFRDSLDQLDALSYDANSTIEQTLNAFTLLEKCQEDQNDVLAVLSVNPELGYFEKHVQVAIANALEEQGNIIWAALRSAGRAPSERYKYTVQWSKKTGEELKNDDNVKITIHLPTSSYSEAKIDRASLHKQQDAAKQPNPAGPQSYIPPAPTEAVVIVVDKAEVHKMKLAGIKTLMSATGKSVISTMDCADYSDEYIFGMKRTLTNAATVLA